MPPRAGLHSPSVSHILNELHIEQGAVLDQLGYPVGVVTAIAGPAHFRVTLKGRADHSGATPMNLRRDPLLAAVKVILAAERLAKEASPTAVATVGKVRVEPGAVNVIPGLVEFSLDIRDIEKETRDGLIRSFLGVLEEACQEGQIEGQVEENLRVDSVPFSPRLQGVLARACEETGVPAHRKASGAGHDAILRPSSGDGHVIRAQSRGGQPQPS